MCPYTGIGRLWSSSHNHANWTLRNKYNNAFTWSAINNAMGGLMPTLFENHYLDSVVVSSFVWQGLFSFFYGGGPSMKSLRVLRVLRPLRTVRRMPRVQVSGAEAYLYVCNNIHKMEVKCKKYLLMLYQAPVYIFMLRQTNEHERVRGAVTTYRYRVVVSEEL